MSDMIERVARAICASRGLDPDRVMAMNSAFDDGRPEAAVASPAWRNHTAAARAAIEAMREPTPEMLEAVDRADIVVDAGGFNVSLDSWEADKFWPVMISAALQRHERGNADSK